MSEYSVFLSGFWGFFFFFTGLLLLFFPKFKTHLLSEITEHSTKSFAIALTLTIGVFHIFFHNKWNNLLETIISSLGVLSLAKGIIILVYPKFIYITSRMIDSKFTIPIGVIYILISFYFLTIIFTKSVL